MLCFDPPDLNTIPCLGAGLLNVGYGDPRGRFLDLSYSGNYGVPLALVPLPVRASNISGVDSQGEAKQWYRPALARGTFWVRTIDFTNL